MTLRLSLSPDILNEDGSPRDTDWVGPLWQGGTRAITTVHSSAGSSEVLEIYVFNDGRRHSDGDTDHEYVYKNVYIEPIGYPTQIIAPNGFYSDTDQQIMVNDASKYNAGTKLIVTDPDFKTEEIWIKQLQGNTLIVDRGKGGKAALPKIPDGSHVQAKTDHVFLSITGNQDDWVNGRSLAYPDVLDKWIPHKFYLRIFTGALKTQVKIDTYLQARGNEYPKIY